MKDLSHIERTSEVADRLKKPPIGTEPWISYAREHHEAMPAEPEPVAAEPAAAASANIWEDVGASAASDSRAAETPSEPKLVIESLSESAAVVQGELDELD